MFRALAAWSRPESAGYMPRLDEVSVKRIRLPLPERLLSAQIAGGERESLFLSKNE